MQLVRSMMTSAGFLVDPRRTFIWNEPIIYFAEGHCRNYLKWSSLQDLLRLLRGATP